MSDIKMRIQSNIQIDCNGCWLWKGKPRHGYGRIRFNGKQCQLHRVAYEVHIGPIPKGMCVCHKCDVKLCCNPAHFFIGTLTDNNHDRDSKFRMNPCRGDRNPQSKIKDCDISQLIDLSDCGRFPITWIAKIYGIHPRTLYGMITGKTRQYRTGITKRYSGFAVHGKNQKICGRCGRKTSSVKSVPVNEYCNSCYHHLRRREEKEALGIKTRKYTYKKKFNLARFP